MVARHASGGMVARHESAAQVGCLLAMHQRLRWASCSPFSIHNVERRGGECRGGGDDCLAADSRTDGMLHVSARKAEWASRGFVVVHGVGDVKDMSCPIRFANTCHSSLLVLRVNLDVCDCYVVACGVCACACLTCFVSTRWLAEVVSQRNVS